MDHSYKFSTMCISHKIITFCKTDVPTKPENFTGDFEKRIYRWTFSDFFMEQTVTIIALNDPGNFVTADFQSFVSKLAFGD